MGRAKTLALAGAAALMSTASLAADLAPPMRAPIPVPVVAGGWYLRGYIGSSNEFLKEITHPDFLTAPAFGFLDKGGFDAAPFGGGGIGYQWNNWFRVDATLEYRGFAQFHALLQSRSRAYPEGKESEGDSRGCANMIQAGHWAEASMDGTTLFGRPTHPDCRGG